MLLSRPTGAAAPRRRGVAFFVGLTNNIGPISQHADIVFDRVVTNVGDAYDEDTGRFTAPVNGTYQFNVNIAAQGRQKVYALFCRITFIEISLSKFVQCRPILQNTTAAAKKNWLIIRKLACRTIIIDGDYKSGICASHGREEDASCC